MKTQEERAVRDKAIIHDYIEKCMHVADIASQHELSIHGIRKVLRDNGVKRGRAYIEKNMVPWNKGLTAETNEKLQLIGDNRRGDKNPMHKSTGRKPWNAGKTSEDSETLKRISLSRQGIKFSPDTIEKMRLAKLGKRGPETNRWKGGKKMGGKYEATQVSHNVYKYTHRTVAAKHYGAANIKGKHIHHIDRNKNNNDIANLIVISSKDHNALHRWISSNPDIADKEGQISFLQNENIWFMSVT